VLVVYTIDPHHVLYPLFEEYSLILNFDSMTISLREKNMVWTKSYPYPLPYNSHDHLRGVVKLFD